MDLRLNFLFMVLLKEKKVMLELNAKKVLRSRNLTNTVFLITNKSLKST